MNKVASPTTIYMADLTHNGVVLSSNVFPLSIGLIASYLDDHRPSEVTSELFKYPDDLSRAIESKQPEIVAFANYSWNFAISLAYAEQIKKIWPETVIVFGGPNYGVTDEEVDTFWKKNKDKVDFHVVREGEHAFVQLFDELKKVEFNADSLKETNTKIGNVHYFNDGVVVKGEVLDRVKLEDLPSPYLKGMMDKFFDEDLCPLIHTTRGCPFKCAFCTEGAEYYNKVHQRLAPLQEELDYISSRVKGPSDLFISDANFGMFKQDQEKANLLASCQEKYGFPKKVHVSTGKNQKERVLDVVQSLNGAISLAASLQSTDESVLSNVSRSNISVEQLAEVGQKANNKEMGTYSEIILGLPGDSLEKHKKTLRDTAELKFDNIRMYQLIMLPQTVINTPEMKREHQMMSRFRIIPRSFGKYTLAGKEFVAVESEEILIGSKTLPHEDYIRAREMDLTVEILHNGGGFKEVMEICKAHNLSWFDDIIMKFYDARYTLSNRLTDLYRDFVKGTSEGLWDTHEELSNDVSKNIDLMLVDERGTNEMSTGKASAFFECLPDMNEHVFSMLIKALEKENKLTDELKEYIKEVERYSLYRKQNFLKDSEFVEDEFNIDLEAVEMNIDMPDKDRLVLKSPKRYRIDHNQDQIELINQYSKEFGFSLDGLGKMIMRNPYIHKLFRNAKPVSS